MSYIYATGRIRVLETRLLSANTVERMLGAQDAQEAWRALSESDYARLLDEFSQPSQVEEMTMRHLRDTRLALQKMVGTAGPLEIIWHKFDFHNLRAYTKVLAKEGTLENLKEMLLPLGSYSREEWLNLFEKKTNQLPETWIQLSDAALAKYQETGNPQEIDFLIDRAYFQDLDKLAHKYGPFFSGYARRLIDLYNITLRLRLMDDDAAFKANFAPGGYLTARTFDSADGLEKRITGVGKGYSSLADGIIHFREEGSFSHLDKLSDDLMTDYLSTARSVSYGPEVVFSYWLAKKNNAMIVRTIITAKLSGISPNRLRPRLRRLY